MQVIVVHADLKKFPTSQRAGLDPHVVGVVDDAANEVLECLREHHSLQR